MKYLVIGPGGVFFYVILGHVYRLYKSGFLEDLREVSGASAGSLVAFLWTLGKDTIFDYVFTQELAFKTNPLLLIKKFGLVDIQKFREKLVHLCTTVLGFEDISFKEHFEKTGIVLHVSTFSLDKCENVYYSVHNAPDMSVLDAISMSCAVPLYFTPFRNHVDGGLVESVPVTPFCGFPPSDMYVVSIDKTYPTLPTKSLAKYVYTLCCAILNHRFQPVCPHMMSLQVPHDMTPVTFNISNEDRVKMFSVGYASIPAYSTYRSSLETQIPSDPTPFEEPQREHEHHSPHHASETCSAIQSSSHSSDDSQS